MILSTIGTEADAQTIAEKLITSKNAACVNIIPGIQ
ncbi:MAG: divalent cation tolerance protein CutA, partial [Candidatus Marinimicrobia bacterium]|nr:divalent cation tolerance protein CutA [Candidatus Neomarinimicrobiota bacterium]